VNRANSTELREASGSLECLEFAPIGARMHVGMKRGWPGARSSTMVRTRSMARCLALESTPVHGSPGRQAARGETLNFETSLVALDGRDRKGGAS